MNNHTWHEQQSAAQLYEFAQAHANYYSTPEDAQAATLALLAEAFILAGGENLIKLFEGDK